MVILQFLDLLALFTFYMVCCKPNTDILIN